MNLQIEDINDQLSITKEYLEETCIKMINEQAEIIKQLQERINKL